MKLYCQIDLAFDIYMQCQSNILNYQDLAQELFYSPLVQVPIVSVLYKNPLLPYNYNHSRN